MMLTSGWPRSRNPPPLCLSSVSRADEAKLRIAAFQASRNGVLNAIISHGDRSIIQEIDASG